jgi:precorrin-6B methylase 2
MRDCASIWDDEDKARAYVEMQRRDEKRIISEIDALPLSPHSRVLDIGAGPGTYAIPLAPRVSHVTAVEPASGMVSVLRERMDHEQLSNIDCVQKRWEDVSIESDLSGPYDVVIASYSLGMTHIREALASMHRSSSSWVYIYWFAGENSWERDMRALWPSLHGRKYQSGPRANVLFNVLYEMGICPCIDVRPIERSERYKTLDEAVSAYCERFNVTGPDKREILRDHLSTVLHREGDELVYYGRRTGVRMWWHVSKMVLSGDLDE